MHEREQAEKRLFVALEDVCNANEETSTHDTRSHQISHTNHALKLLIDKKPRGIVDSNSAATIFSGYTGEELLRYELPSPPDSAGFLQGKACYLKSLAPGGRK